MATTREESTEELVHRIAQRIDQRRDALREWHALSGAVFRLENEKKPVPADLVRMRDTAWESVRNLEALLAYACDDLATREERGGSIRRRPAR